VADKRLFLIEVGTEELPPKALRQLSEAFLEHIRRRLKDRFLDFDEAEAFATPRRLAVKISGLASRQPDREIERRGPPLKVALDDDGRPTQAGIKFAESCNTSFDALDRLDTGKGVYLVYCGREPGRAAEDVLPEVLEEALADLPIPKRMRWGDTDFEFVRPVHWIVALLDTDVLAVDLFGVRADRVTRGHRFLAPDPIVVPDAASYPAVLEDKGRVIARFDERRERVLAMSVDSATKAGGRPVYDDGLADEVTALVEWPVPVVGEFEPRFLELNPLPTFAPDGSFAVLAELAGRPHEELLAEVFGAGLARLGLA